MLLRALVFAPHSFLDGFRCFKDRPKLLLVWVKAVTDLLLVTRCWMLLRFRSSEGGDRLFF